MQYCVSIDLETTWMSFWIRVAWHLHEARLAKPVAIYSTISNECAMQVRIKLQHIVRNEGLIQSMTYGHYEWTVLEVKLHVNLKYKRVYLYNENEKKS